MLFTLDKQLAPFSSVILVESLDYYSSMFVVTSSTPIVAGRYEYVGNNGFSSCIQYDTTRLDYINNQYRMFLFPAGMHEMMENVFYGYNGYATVEQLADNIGFTYRGPKTNNTYWDIPRCRYKTLVKLISEYASVIDGGGSRITLSYDKTMQMIDYRYNYLNGKPILLIGNQENVVYNIDWQNEVCGSMTINKFFPDGEETEELEIVPTLGHGNADKYLSSRDATNLPSQYYRNKFYSYYYSSRQCNVKCKGFWNLPIGSLVTLTPNMNDERPTVNYIVRSRTLNFLGDDVESTTFQLIGF